MARTKASLGAGARLADYLMVGYLALNCPLERVRETLVRCGAQSKRRRDLPHEVLVYYLMCLCLYRRAAYEEVFALVVAGLRGLTRIRSERSSSARRPSRLPAGRWAVRCLSRSTASRYAPSPTPCQAYSGVDIASWRSTGARTGRAGVCQRRY